MAALMPVPQFRYFTNTGTLAPLAGGKIYFYEAGTLTLKDTYTDSTGDTANTNPVVLDSQGFANIWGTGAYKMIVKTSADVTISTTDNIS